MRLSAFTVVDAFPDGSREADRSRYREILDLAAAGEKAGLSTLWVAEHHFHPGGVCPSPPVLLAAAGQCTRRLRLGVLVSVLPFHNPVELAEQYALLDQLLDGRLNIGVGSGYIPMEFEGFGINPETKRDRFDKALEVFQAALRGDRVRVSETSQTDVQINVRPRQRPYPPIWVAVQRREAIPYVGRRGTNIALVPYATVESPKELGEEIREFRNALPPGVTADVSVALHLYAGAHPERARAALQRFLDSRLATQSTFYQEKVRRDARHASAETIERSGFALFGSPEDLKGPLARFRDLGVDEVLGIVDFGGLAQSDVFDSVAALGTLVRSVST